MQPSLNIAFRQMTKNEKNFSLRPAISIFQIYFFISYNIVYGPKVETKQRKGGNKTERGGNKTEERWKQNRGRVEEKNRWKVEEKQRRVEGKQR